MASPRLPAFQGRTRERQVLDRLLESGHTGRSAVLLLRGEAGVGKTALLRYCARQASGYRVEQIAGIESEMELPYAGVHQLCAPMLDQLTDLPPPQQDALRTAFGLSSGAAPDRFLVALGDPQPAGTGGGGAAPAVPRGRRSVARHGLGSDRRLRGPPPAARNRWRWCSRSAPRAPSLSSRACRSSRSEGSPTRMPVPCSRRSSRVDSTTASATGSSKRRAAIPSRCWSCRAAWESRSWPVASRFPTPGNFPITSKSTTCDASAHCPRRPSN